MAPSEIFALIVAGGICLLLLVSGVDTSVSVNHHIDGKQVIDERPVTEVFHILTDSTGKEWLAIDNNVIIYGELILVCDSIPCAKEGVLDE